MRACADEIKILITRMLITRAEVTQLHQVVAKSMRGAFHQVIAFAPGERCIVHFEFDVLFQIGNAQSLQTAEDLLARSVTDRCPILLRLFSVFTHVPNRDNRDQGVLSLRSHGWIEPARSMNVKTGVGWQGKGMNDRVKVLAVILRQKKRMWVELFVWFIHSPEEADDGTGKPFTLQTVRLTILRE